MIHSLSRLTRLFLLAFVVIAGGLAFWGLAAQQSLIGRQDNPRRVLAEQQIRQGAIVDRDGRPLVTSILDESSNNTFTRYTLYPEAAPVVGFYSLRHGTGGIENTYETTIHGDRFIAPLDGWLNNLLHRTQVGGDIQLTVSLPLQQAARAALGGRSGAIVLLDASSGDVLAMDSLPTFDPNTLDEKWDSLRADPAAPLLNRATQALYQPGSVLQGIVLGEAINSGSVLDSDPWTGPAEARFSNGVLPCTTTVNVSLGTYGDSFIWGCPGAFQSVGGLLGVDDLERGFSDFGLDAPPPFDLPVAAISTQSTAVGEDPANIAIGQGSLTVTPLHMALVAAAFSNRGQIPAARLVSALRAPGASWLPTVTTATPRGTISADSAEIIKVLMRAAVQSGAARSAAQPGHDIYGNTGLALAGPDLVFNSWFVGFVYTDDHRPIAIAVLLERTSDTQAAARIGGLLLAEAATVAEK